jgi:hypothetical protein
MQRQVAILLIMVAVVGLGLALSSTVPKVEQAKAAAQEKAPASTPGLIAVAAPPFSPDVFPCSECHLPDDEINREPHAVPDHEAVVFEHNEENRWCLDCHDAKSRDMLHLADGRLIPFEESFKLCGQCHGPELRDWKVGIHGKRTGSWSGAKEYLLCAHCHNPHSPAIKPVEPLPAPTRQEDIR